jgi:hypothetical protein
MVFSSLIRKHFCLQREMVKNLVIFLYKKKTVQNMSGVMMMVSLSKITMEILFLSVSNHVFKAILIWLIKCANQYQKKTGSIN